MRSKGQPPMPPSTQPSGLLEEGCSSLSYSGELGNHDLLWKPDCLFSWPVSSCEANYSFLTMFPNICVFKGQSAGWGAVFAFFSWMLGQCRLSLGILMGGLWVSLREDCVSFWETSRVDKLRKYLAAGSRWLEPAQREDFLETSKDSGRTHCRNHRWASCTSSTLLFLETYFLCMETCFLCKAPNFCSSWIFFSVINADSSFNSTWPCSSTAHSCMNSMIRWFIKEPHRNIYNYKWTQLLEGKGNVWCSTAGCIIPYDTFLQSSMENMIGPAWNPWSNQMAEGRCAHGARSADGACYLSMGNRLGGNACHLSYRKTFRLAIHKIIFDQSQPSWAWLNKPRALHPRCWVQFWLTAHAKPDSLAHDSPGQRTLGIKCQMWAGVQLQVGLCWWMTLLSGT